MAIFHVICFICFVYLTTGKIIDQGSGCRYGRRISRIIEEQDKMIAKLDKQNEMLLNLVEKVDLLLQEEPVYTTMAPPAENYSSCADIYNDGITQSGAYVIHVDSSDIEVFCDMSDGGGWTVFQRRFDGSVDFLRNWNDYKNGFGNVTWEFWLGNDILAAMTADGTYTLRVDARSFAEVRRSYDYTSFKVDTEENKYKLNIDPIEGQFSLTQNNQQYFTTFDRDNDNYEGNCADKYKGGWWYSNSCGYTNLNGPYGGERVWEDQMFWFPLDEFYTIPFSQMKFRPS